jgi:signal transduction histidine kinase
MSRRVRARSARGLAVLLLAVSVPTAVAVIWLGARLLEQDRALVAQRDQERRQAAAPRLARALDRILLAAEAAIETGPLPEHAVRLTLTPDGAVIDPAGSAAWVPVAAPMPEPADAPFAEADAAVGHDAPGALRRYETLARSSNPAVRAGALLRIARQHWVAEEWSAALSAYDRLAAITSAAVLGAPADLQARRWKCDLLAEIGDEHTRNRELAALERDLAAGRWTLDKATWDFVSQSLQAATGRPVPIERRRLLVAELASALWDARKAGSAGGDVHRSTFRDRTGQAAIVLSRTAGDRVSALAFSAQAVAAWIDAARPAAMPTGAIITASLESGDLLTGPSQPAGGSTVVLTSSETRLPWTLSLGRGDTADLVAENADRRGFVYGALGATLVLLVGGTLFVWSVMRRELAVSRVQTEFVAAVSHEFRTPLTALRHVTDLLEDHDDDPAERRQFYGALSRNTLRLQRLVEGLLDFSRMESGRRPYDLREIDARELVREVVEGFRDETASTGATVAFEADESPLTIRADAASLSTALWNLLDNAVKYSTGRPDIHVQVTRRAASVAIAVRDRGLGVPAGERREIFERFVRGTGVASRGIKGTGLGLALVSHILSAHGGSIELDSEEGVGSTFTMVVPCLGS